MKLGWWIVGVFLLVAAVPTQFWLWDATGDGSAPLWIQIPGNVFLGLCYLGLAWACLVEATR